MRLSASHDLLLVLKLNLSPLQSQSQSHLNTNPSLFPIPHSLSFFTRSPTRSNSVHGRVHSTPPFPRISSHSHSHSHLVPETIVILTFTTLLLFLRLFSNALLPDFPRRWRNLIAFSAEAELRASSYPWHVWQAIVAYEDRRFFKHCGIDPVGITRAVLSFSARGGGSTITQQIYWGHGIYGIKSASIFYFGKHPSLLSLGESAILAGIIPAPELRSPLRDPSRGKSFQARVLRRMVEVGSLDIETALLVVKQSLHLHVDVPEYADRLLHLLPLSKNGLGGSSKLNQGGTDSTFKVAWDWEKESMTWEAWEDMDRWAINKVQAIDRMELQKKIVMVVTKWIFRTK